MSESPKAQTFLHGTVLLALSTAIVKIVGALYKIPLNAIIGPEGFSYFNTAYDIYTVLLMISSAGLPVAMSRMISQANSLGNYRQVRKIYAVCRTIFLTLGLAGGLLMTLFCRQLAQFQQQPDAWAAIAALGPCAFFICLISTYRGFFQGQSNMLPTSVSQVVEAVCKLVIGMAAALIVLHYTGSIPLAAAGAILGVTVGTVLSALYLKLTCAKAYRTLPQTDEAVSSGGQIAKQLLAIAVPITIGSAGLQLLTVLETGIYMDRLVDMISANRYTLPLVEILQTELTASGAAAAELPSKVAANLKGIYNFAQTIYNMPTAFIVPITASVLPAVTAQLTLKNDGAVRATEESAARVAGLLSLPCTVGLCVLAEPVMGLLGGYTGEKLTFAGHMMLLLGVCVFLYAVIQYTNMILQSHGYAHVPVINMLSCGVVKLVVVSLLTRNPAIGIYGVPMGTILCYSCIGLLNLLAIRKLVPQKPRLLRSLLRPILPAAVMGVAVYGCYWAIVKLLGADASRVILCGVPVVVGVVVYLVCVVLFKTVKREDCLLLPKGEKIAKLLHL